MEADFWEWNECCADFLSQNHRTEKIGKDLVRPESTLQMGLYWVCCTVSKGVPTPLTPYIPDHPPSPLPSQPTSTCSVLALITIRLVPQMANLDQGI